MAVHVDIRTLGREVGELHEAFPVWTLDNAFVHWFLRAFLVADDEVAAKAVTGVSHDKGVDGVYIDEDLKKAFVLQGKFHQGEKAPHESRNDVLSFASLSKKLAASENEFRTYLTDIDAVVGKKLAQVRDRVQRRGYKLHLYYVTTGKCSSPLKDEAESEVSQANIRAEVSILDRQEVLALLVDYIGGAAPPVPYLDLRIDSRGITGSDGAIQRFDEKSGIESWLLTISGKELGELYDRSGDRLFSRNIRGFLGDTAINEGMRNTLKEDPKYFWYFNNGVTLVCNSARKTAEHGQAILRVSNPQIINGQQTTRTLHEVRTKNAAVLVRVISIPRDPFKNQVRFEQLVSNIVAATNWQNAILPSDLRANDARQVALERDFAKLRYQYLRKRQTKHEARRLLGNQRWRQVKKDELAQLVAACELGPQVVRSGKEGLFEEPNYDEIFDGRSAQEYLVIYWLGRAVKYYGKGYPDRSYAKWLVLHFLWNQIGPFLRGRRSRECFRENYERDQWSSKLGKAINQIYGGALDFYRKFRGKGAKAVDISNFFYKHRANLQKDFLRYWKSSSNRHRARTRKFLERFKVELREQIHDG